MPKGSHIIATQVTSSFLIPTKLCFILSILIIIPALLQQIWAFISPGLYKSEKHIVAPLIIYSAIQFYLGTLFGFTVICPLALNFFAASTPENVKMLTDIGEYLDFIVNISFLAGLSFQVPIITYALVKFDICSKQSLIKKRPYVIVLAFTLGMLLTPPDVISQILLAIPIWALFELGLLLSTNKKNNQATTGSSSAD